jgi:hypothetical protein
MVLMSRTANLYLVAIALAVLLLGLAAIYGAGFVSGLGGWPNFSAANPIEERETIIHEERPPILEQVQALARLETSKYVLEQVIEAEKSTDALRREFLFGDRIFLIAHGYVTAGIDLEKIEKADINIDEEDNSVWLMLPQTEIFTATLDNELTRVYDRQRGWLTRGDIHLETDARRDAEASILEAACDYGILEEAAEDAEWQMTRFLSLLDFENITILAPVGNCEAAEETVDEIDDGN